ncbi:Arc family DNA-binding protein [Pseudomonas sp. P8_250]|uniref:Arc family DNA-binding protein n=1 Tax=Pseudomonas sp. P8_250 TaxID=3043446 RepID=UPI002A36A376|nr:Arc family DNA-binding protein [Pseudomonas sp. P8_250]MDX9668712.1 Arc family DNA-binding protein [Pseudomonas sp. P8_250]
MNSVNSPIALAALQRALGVAKIAPVPRPRGHSRTADKFVIRAYSEMYIELDGIGRYQGRSRNSEIQSAVLEALGGWKRTTAELNIYIHHLGKVVSKKILAEIPDFDISQFGEPDKKDRRNKFVLRFPPNVRDMVRDGIANKNLDAENMNAWFVATLVRWIMVQRKLYALLSAAIAIDPDLVIPGYYEP